MAEKARTFQDRRAEELIMSSPDPRAHQRTGRGVREIDYAIWARDEGDDVLARPFSQFLQNPVIKHHLPSTGTDVWLKQALTLCVGYRLSGGRPRGQQPESAAR